MEVKVYCEECTDEDNDPLEMTGAEFCSVNAAAKTQCRSFTCPVCRNVVHVVLDFSSGPLIN